MKLCISVCKVENCETEMKFHFEKTNKYADIKVGHLLLELGFDLETFDTLLLTLLSKIRPHKFDTTISMQFRV